MSRAKTLGFQLLTRDGKRGNNKRKSTLCPPAKASPHLPFFCSEREGKACSVHRHAPAAAHRGHRSRDMGAAEGPGCHCAGLSCQMRAATHPKFLLTLGKERPGRRPRRSGVGTVASLSQRPHGAARSQCAAAGSSNGTARVQPPLPGAMGLQPQRDITKRRGEKKNQIKGRKQRRLPCPGTGRAGGGGRRTPARWHGTAAPSGADCHFALGLGAPRSRRASVFFVFSFCLFSF